MVCVQIASSNIVDIYEIVRSELTQKSEAATGGILCKGPAPATLLRKSLRHKCFPVNFAIFFRTLFLQPRRHRT